MVGRIWRFFIRISAFLRKEVFEVWRQPRLILTLILGPFLILLLFGIGYRVKAEPVRSLFVMQEDNPFREYLEEYTSGINPLLDFAGVSDSEVEAKARLRRRELDLVIVLPEDPLARIENSEQAVFQIFHNEIDPFQVDYIEAFARIYIDEVNRHLLADIAEEGQEQSGDAREIVSTTRDTAGRMRQALESGEIDEAMRYRDQLVRGAGLAATLLGSTADLLEGVEQRFEAGDVEADPVVTSLNQIQEEVAALSQMEADQDDYSEEAARAARIEEQFASLEEAMGDFEAIAPTVIVSPFRGEVQDIAQAPLRLSDFYVPSAIALLTQHLAITFAALSIVRERRGGTIELFRVSPVSAIETMLGKYLSYFVFETILLAILTALVLWGLRVPMVGQWANYALITGVLIFTSLGLGFVISLVAETTSQAVQYSMIVLLASIFFSGFFLSLQLLRPAVRIVSWLLPATYATQMLQNVMLRGTFGDVELLYVLALMGAAFFILAWLLLRRKMARR